MSTPLENTQKTKRTAYDKVVAARSKDRNSTIDFIKAIFTDFIEMHGDRRFGDDRAVIAGIGYLGNTPVTVIGIEKGKDLKTRALRNFGSAHPEGYRKALRQMKLAEKFGRPVICLIDTSGAYCGIGAEERGQGQAIAENLMEMMTLGTPIISVLIGEGGSGGALALAVADEVWILENSVYSVISPEGCASILWKDSSKVKEASECLKLTPEDLLKYKVVEKIIPECKDLFEDLKSDFTATINKLQKLPKEKLTEKRYQRFRKIGEIK
jgi:acetyl-CoA carboxylase, carboxyl transferase, alpha subunit